MSSLRTELLGEQLPEFVLALPPGWVRSEVSPETKERMLAQARSRLLAANRPDLYAQVMSLTARAFRGMEQTETIAFFGPAPDAPEESFLPVSLTASVRRGADGATLDETISRIIRASGATPLGDDKRWVRWVTSSREEVEGVGVDTTTVAYLTPVPGTGRRRGLQLTAVITHDSAAEGDADWLEQVQTVLDLYVSTFGWVES